MTTKNRSRPAGPPAARPRSIEPIRDVIVALETTSSIGRAFLEGIFWHLRAGSHWNIHLLQTMEAFTPDVIRTAEREGTSGIIVSRVVTPETLRALAKTRLPTVAIGMRYPPFDRRRRNITFIINDDTGIGRLAARHLLSLGNFRSFAFVPFTAPVYWAEARGSGFAAALAEKGVACRRFRRPPRATTEADRAALCAWLTALPKPVAVFAADDIRASHVLDACRQAGIRVPDQAAILGVDNDALLCDYMVPPLSSIGFATPDEGVLAGRELSRLMDARKPMGLKVIRWERREVVVRESAEPVAPAAQLVRRALSFIDKNACTGIGVPDVVRALGVSRRLADLRFRELEGRSILESILDRRFAELKRMLGETRRPIKRLAADCGFGNPANLARQFRGRFGLTMGAFRAKHPVRP